MLTIGDSQQYRGKRWVSSVTFHWSEILWAMMLYCSTNETISRSKDAEIAHPLMRVTDRNSLRYMLKPVFSSCH